ncbi:hypothetical protein OHS33_39415 (plasmid) [Streptomyces sp. NBC_00536]|uniref:hypothetical protein n=1 Tax=Streptomyces sp. NBC_00536 TaxID=2975769 RepID=UPI002E808942|nr:hypothetical protein [Streptomyces sp. NBC_00536]WUC84525.1 hypothetical protein OHS33_39415 [Streptomyces sp. NBC_00536]
MSTTVQLFTLAADGGLIPGSTPTKIPGLDGPVTKIFGYALWLLILAGVGGTGYGVYKLAVSDKSRNGGGSEPFKWMGGGVATILLAGSLITILNGIATG